jgi:predicted nuclease with TOPRIM domain
MKATEILQKLKEQFAELVNQPTQTPVKMMQATLKDGTIVEVTALEIGGIVTIEGVPAPVGQHELSDGTIIVLGENGAIMEIMPMTEEVEIEAKMPKVEDMGAKFSSLESATNEKFATYETKFASYETKFAEYESKLNKATQLIEGLMNLTKTLAETPTGAPDLAVKNNFTETKKTRDYSILFS